MLLLMAGLLSGAAYTMRTEGGELGRRGSGSGARRTRHNVEATCAIGAAAVVLGFALVGGSYILLEGGPHRK